MRFLFLQLGSSGFFFFFGLCLFDILLLLRFLSVKAMSAFSSRECNSSCALFLDDVFSVAPHPPPSTFFFSMSFREDDLVGKKKSQSSGFIHFVFVVLQEEAN